MDIIIDGSRAIQSKNKLYRGAGMVSANNSSRLLLDYKAENPSAYWRLLELIFGDKGIAVNHLKIEMGSDVNSSSGTEPCVKRSSDEPADVTRGVGYQLASDAKLVNPELTLDMLWWSEPRWVTDAEDVYDARYRWYKESLDSAYNVYGLKFDYVSVVRNERDADFEWIKYFSARLKNEVQSPYDYSAIKIVGGEEVSTWFFADKMLEDKALLEAVDVVGSHYTSRCTENAKRLADEYGKELWFSEGCSPMSYAKGVCRFDGNGSGMSDINGALDIALRIISMFPLGNMTLHEYQPVISSYYDGVTYCQKHIISACDPWSGYYNIDLGFYIALHFSQFIKKGWQFIDGACYADGKAGGDGHAIVDAVYSFTTVSDPISEDYSVVLANSTAEEISYNFTVCNLKKASSDVFVWETRGSDGGCWDENYFKNIKRISPKQVGENYVFEITIKPYSLVTLSTVEHKACDFCNPDESERKVLSLPYSDDYEYADYPKNYLASRGSAPRYTTDEGGAFEVVRIGENNVLMQKITANEKADEWGYTPNPTTNFGDDRWNNYSVSADVMLSESQNPSENYVGIGLRYNLGDLGQSGYWVQIFEDGRWALNRNSDTVKDGKLANFDKGLVHRLKISANGGRISAFADGVLVCDYTDDVVLSAGRVAFYSSYNTNSFDNLLVEPIENCTAFITRFDDTDDCFEYDGDWLHTTMGTFKHYKRTISTGRKNAVATVKFCGTSFAIMGQTAEGGIISVEVDGAVINEAYAVAKASFRELSLYVGGLENKPHTAIITVLDGEYSIDGLQVEG